MAGTIPVTVPQSIYARGRTPLLGAQPPAQVPRLGLARLVWIGEDPLAGSPVVTLQREVGSGVFEDVSRRSGRVVKDGDLLLTWTPEPLVRQDGSARTHYWVAEWQAVPPSGMPLDEAAGLPLGRYRLHAQGIGYDVSSDPFEVVPATLRVQASSTTGAIDLTVEIDGTGGFRLLDLEEQSDRPVPLRGQTVMVSLDGAPAVSVALDNSGHATLAGVALTEVRVTDRFGNSGTDAP
jgi:hypothetical protein